MPLYCYVCPRNHETDLVRPVAERNDPVECEVCGQPAGLEIQTAAFDPRMGLDPSFPTMQSKWAKARYKASKGR